MQRNRLSYFQLPIISLMLALGPAHAQDDDAAAAMAKALQDPLASIKALITDNSISFDGGAEEDDTTYNFQVQPVYSIPNEGNNNYIARGVFPIIGIEPGVVKPPLGPEPTPDDGSTWGLGDSFLQLFISPRSDSAIKWGIGPQVSLPTHSNDRVKGPGWGAGLAGVIVGGSGNWAYSALLGQHWGEDDFELATIQPGIWWNSPTIPGLAIGYSNTITYNWNADSGQRWNIPLGVTVGRTLALDSGNGLDLNIGLYNMVERPDSSPEWQIKLGISWLFN